MRKGRTRLSRTLLALLAVIGAGMALCAPAFAATIDPNTMQDELDPEGDFNCSPREAVIAANTDMPFNECPPGSGADTIHLQAGTYTLSLSGGENDFFFNPNVGDLDVLGDTRIVGAGARATTIRAMRGSATASSTFPVPRPSPIQIRRSPL